MKIRKHAVSIPPTVFAIRVATTAALLLATTAHAATRTWDGNGGTSDWGEVNLNPLGSLFQNTNWTDNSVIPLPLDGDTLVFAGTRRLDANNNLDGLAIAGITFLQGAGGFILQGNGIRSTGDILNRSSTHQRVALPVVLGASQIWDGGTAGLTFLKPVNLGGYALTLTNGVVIDNGETIHTIAGSESNAVLRVNGGSRVTSAGLELARAATGTLVVSGAGSKWSSAGGFETGAGGSGTLTIEQGGIVEGSHATLAVEGPAPFNSGRLRQGGHAEVTVTGPGSRWSLTGRLDLGVSGTGTLRVESGGRVETASARLGVAAGSVLDGTTGRGTVVVDGPGSVWNNAGALIVGLGGWGQLTVQAGGFVGTRSLTMGVEQAFPGRVTVTGAGSRLAVAETMEVGRVASGRLEILAGGTVTSTSAYVGHSGSFGDTEARVSGAGSSWTVAGRLAIGEGTTGSLIVTDGGAVASGSGVVGNRILQLVLADLPGSGNTQLRGAGTSWTVSGDLVVGMAAPGTVTVSEGAHLASGSARLGASRVTQIPGSPLRSIHSGSGTVSLAGAGSRWQATGRLAIGDEYGTGILTISDGARVEVDGSVVVDLGTIALAGGSLRTTDLAFGGASTLRIAISGAAPRGALGPAEASGTARLDGTLEVEFLDEPIIATSFVVLTFGQHLGRFATLDVTGLGDGRHLLATYGAHDLTLTVAAVPEPHTYAMLLAGLACCAAARRRVGSPRGRPTIRQ